MAQNQVFCPMNQNISIASDQNLLRNFQSLYFLFKLYKKIDFETLENSAEWKSWVLISSTCGNPQLCSDE